MSARALDVVDRAIVERLALDARTSNQQIAEQVGVTEGTVRARIKRMQEERQIRITAVTNIDRFRGGALAYIWALDTHMIPIPGFKSVAQVVQNAGAMALGPLAKDELHQIDEIVDRYRPDPT